MADPAESENQNLLPVQAYFSVDGEFQTFIGQGQPFYATVDPDQSGLHITNSTIDSTTIGATTPSTGVFTNVATTTGTIATAPSANTDIVNKQYVDAVAQGLNPKQAVKCATTADISLSGLQTIDTYTTLAGDRVLVKNQSTQSQNGIYIAGSSAWTRATDMDVWTEVPGAYTVILNGGQAQTAWVSTSAETGTINVTPITFVQFAGNSTYYAGTGLSLAANTFSITNTGVTAATKGSASKTVTAAVNAQGQLTSLTDQDIAISNTQVSGLGTMSTQNAGSVAITGGTIDGTTIGGTTAGAVTGTTVTATTFNGAGTGLTGTASGLSIGGNAATATTAGSATTATTATNLAGGAAGSVPYQASSGSTSMLSAGSNGQVLTLSGGLPVWNTPTVGTVTSVGGTGTVSGISLSGTVTSSGNLTLGGTLDLSSPPAIGGTTPAAITGTTITADTKFVSQEYYAQSILGGNLRTSSGTSLLNWDGGGSGNITVNGGLLANPSNKNISLAPTGTGTVTINPATASEMDNVAVGGTTPLAGTFTNLRFNTNLSINGSTGTIGQVLTSNGSGLPTWTTPSSSIAITDDTTTNSTRYPLFAAATTGSISTEYVSSTKYQFNPSTGVLTATQFSGSGAGLTSIPNSALTNSSVTVGSTAISLGGTSTTLAGLTSVTSTTFVGALTGNASTATTATTATNATNTAVTDDTTTNSTFYPTFVSNTSGNLPQTVSSTKFKWNPSTGVLTATGGAVFGATAVLGGLTNPIVAQTGSVNNYVQSYIYNANNGTSSSADFVAYANNSTDAHGWADMGFTSQTYADATYTVTGPNEAYLFGSAPSGAGATGNLVYATDSTGSANAHQFYVGGFTQAKSAWRAQITSTLFQIKGSQQFMGSSSGYVGLQAAAAAGSTTYTLPSADGSTGQVLSTNGSGTLSWASAGGGFPSGTAMLFVQTSAPTGWTKSTTHNDKALRIVSGTAGTGGSVAFTTAFASGLSSGSTTLAESQMPSHTHSSTGGLSVGSGANAYSQANSRVALTTGATGGGGSHTHTLPSFAVSYVDVIIATKD
jgi:hypothetical protein